MTDYAIVAIGYNRPVSMKRLLVSLENAYYADDEVDLIISIDNSGADCVEQCAAEFIWTHGRKIIKTYEERQGLRKHILNCGDYLNDYRAIAVFEDDVIPSESFYQYMKHAVPFYEDDDNIAGISLYNHLWNVNVNMPFQPAYGGSDIYFMQFAQSWGQIWMKKQWQEFINWYKTHDEEFGKQDNIPDFVTGWPKTSWLKYHIKYCIENNKYFVYPYKSLSTCFSDVGEHCSDKDTHLQVPMLCNITTDFRFSKLNDKDSIVYDAFFERVLSEGELIEGVKAKDVCFDIYGSKTSFDGKKYLLSRKIMPYKVIRTYGLELRPHEENVIKNIEGEDIFLYSLNEVNKEMMNTNIKVNKILWLRYTFRIYGKTAVLCKLIADTIKRRLKSKLRWFSR